VEGTEKSPLLLNTMTEKEQIRALIEQHIAGTNQFLVDIKLSVSKLSVSIDKPEGITLDECSSLTRFLLEQLETSGFLETHDVEVGSPGMDSPLLVPQQYLRRIGREMKVRTVEGKEMNAILVSAGPSSAEFKETVITRENKKKITSEVLHTLPYDQIREAKLVLNFKLK
jgi:ribosome maturation factor RimP